MEEPNVVEDAMRGRFLEDVPEFLDFEGEEIGPFEKGEIANLEREITEFLIKDKKVELIDEDY